MIDNAVFQHTLVLQTEQPRMHEIENQLCRSYPRRYMSVGLANYSFHERLQPILLFAMRCVHIGVFLISR